ncbi:MAG: nucleoside 2-deoxyribosyltransferase domain-containing protein [Actinomadura sp.]
MTGEFVVVCAREEPPAAWDAAVFLAGPTPRDPGVASWRPEAIDLLQRQWAGDGRLVVFSPERRSGHYADYTDQIDWEERALHRADVVIFWVPRDLATMPALTTNVEWGMWHDSGRVVFGAPPEAPKNRYLLHYADRFDVPTATTLADTVASGLAIIGPGAFRSGGECDVPLLVWRTASFQRWHTAQRDAGNSLLGARLVWTFRVSPTRRFVVYWALHVQVHIAAEDRVKSNEIVISRPDISVVALFRPGADLDDTDVVLVREFRSPASTPDGYVHELPGGSGPESTDPVRRAAAELEEETGLVVAPYRLRRHGSRQLAATLSAHHAELFSVRLTDDEFDRLDALQETAFGVAADSERTFLESTTFGRIRAENLVDWATLGMLTQALTER